MPPKEKKKAKMPPVCEETDDGVASDDIDDPATVHDEEVALGLQQEDKEVGSDWEENEDHNIEDTYSQFDDESQDESASASSADSNASYVARQRQRAKREIMENWACSSIERAFPPKSWLIGNMSMTKKKNPFKLEDLDTEILLLLQRLSRVTVGASSAIKKKIYRKWDLRHHSMEKHVGTNLVDKQRNILEDLQDLYKDAEQAELIRKAEEDESDASSVSNIPVAGSTIQTLRDRYSALEQVYENWGIQTLVGHFTDGLHREDVTDDDNLDAGVIERLRDLSEVVNTAAHGRRIRRRLWRSLRALEEYDVERVVARIALVGHWYVNVQAEREERRERGEPVSDSSDSEDEDENSGEADKSTC